MTNSRRLEYEREPDVWEIEESKKESYLQYDEYDYEVFQEECYEWDRSGLTDEELEELLDIILAGNKE